MSCDHILLPGIGTWVNIGEGETSVREIYCAECGDVWHVERENVSVEKVGNLNEASDE